MTDQYGRLPCMGDCRPVPAFPAKRRRLYAHSSPQFIDFTFHLGGARVAILDACTNSWAYITRIWCYGTIIAQRCVDAKCQVHQQTAPCIDWTLHMVAQRPAVPSHTCEPSILDHNALHPLPLFPGLVSFFFLFPFSRPSQCSLPRSRSSSSLPA